MAVSIIDVLKIVCIGIIEGITEWLPVSSTGHMLLFDAFFCFNASVEFKNMFFIVIQLGAVLAVLTLFWNKLFPFQFKNKTQPVCKKEVFSTWLKVLIACVPGGIVTILFDNWFEAHFQTPLVISFALIFYGIVFIVVENLNKKRKPKINNACEISYLTALYIGLFQILSIVPGTSRSGATIIGALIIGVKRSSATEFTFFLAVPVMLGYSLLKIFKFGFAFTASEISTMLLGFVVAFAVSFFAIKFLVSFVKRKDFKVFGYYRICLGTLILILLATPIL